MPVHSGDKNPSTGTEFADKANQVLQQDKYIHSVVDLIATENKNQQPFLGQKHHYL